MGEMKDNRGGQPDLGWIVAFALAGAFFVYVVLQFPSVHAMACKQNEQDCLRQWMSALGGWVAVAAAIPTIYYLSRQTRAAAEHQRVNFALAAQTNIALAGAASTLAAELRVIIRHGRGEVGPDVEDRDAALEDGLERLVRISKILDNPLFSEFEIKIDNRFGYSSRSMHAFAVSHTTMLESAARVKVANMGADGWQRLAKSYAKALDFIDSYASDVVKAANEYGRRLEELEKSIS